MTNLPQQDTIKQYVADGVQSTFVCTFFVPLENDGTPNLDVYVTPSGDTPIPEADIKIFNVDYTYTPNLDPITGGTVNFLVGKIPPAGATVTLDRNVQASLDVEFSNVQTFNGQNLDDALDKLLLIEQQNKTYAFQRNISYVVNSFLPDATLQANVQVPVLEAQQVWMGSADGIIAATLEQNPDVSTLRSELANDSPGTDGARLVGYYNTVNPAGTTVNDFLTSLNETVFRVIGKQVLTGTGTYTPTTGTKYCWGRGVGGGGGGAGTTSAPGNAGVGSGGGAGAYGEVWFPAAAMAFSCGAAGSAGSFGAAGGTGGTTTLGSILTLAGGIGGTPQNNNAGAAIAPGVLGGTATLADFGVNGNASGFGFIMPSGGAISGAGGNSPFGAGGIPVAGASTANGNDGLGNGSGGSGAITFGGANAAGGQGTAGKIVIWEFA